MGREFELKYAATQAQQDALGASFGEFTPIAMETTYYDTSDGALSRQHITLRRRLENGVSVCTVKTPGDPEGHAAAINRIFASDAQPIIMTKRSKSGDKEVNILPMIHSVKAVAVDGLVKLRATLRAGNTENLNPEYLIKAMRDRLGILPEDGPTDEVWYRILRIGFHDEKGVETGKWFR